MYAKYPPTISKAQWYFRAMAGTKIYMKIGTYLALVCPYLINGNQMAFLSTLSYTEPGLLRFRWNPEMTVLSIDRALIESSLLDLKEMMDSLFCGCPWQDILDYIDQHTNPPDLDKWFLD
ncbi:uncharacterized protein BJ212DRAFT_1304607 [Suillus subaureus]|uniref:Uncharacterized protein n=1 Tax=Suillus subaureus TaxID=48587 RepID=A0A9P7DUG6_9AGAM|nr:uncharacterized protein BJ212DRAFT_1304607 [Suillus subaureus]KAG1803279.1 hypothetical protein BJ212DRAFT_1304607 [Suillus subaureus]